MVKWLNTRGARLANPRLPVPVAPAGTPTSPKPCPTCGAAPGEPCVYTGSEAVRYMLHRSRKEVTPST